MTSERADDPVAELRRHKAMFDHTWTLATLLATVLAVACWELRLAQFAVAPVIWTLAALAAMQFLLNSRTRGAASVSTLRHAALLSQLLGTALIAVSWHLFGGVQQPLYPLIIVLPLLTGALVLSFWQQQIAIAAVLAVLMSGVLLSPDTNSFIEERYGISLASAHLLPDFLPRSRVVFPDVSTSPAYDLLLTTMVGVVCLALSTTARALVSLCRRDAAQVAALEDEVARLRQATRELVTRTPAPILITSSTGRILHASDRLVATFHLEVASEPFLLDTIAFRHPQVVRHLMADGGEDVQPATVQGRECLLRVRAEVLTVSSPPLTLLSIESSDDLCLRGELDALEEPVFAIGTDGRLMYLNRAALDLLGPEAEGAMATATFDAQAAPWWDIAPLSSARRLLDYRKRRFCASIRRVRVAESAAELSFVQLAESRAAA
ncbi:MAG TPA: PAS domain-containing protein [Steroidobacteraceae bacterium]|nr:PAS domain-containing protein [Steroidobacteraceae bacterium]